MPDELKLMQETFAPTGINRTCKLLVRPGTPFLPQMPERMHSSFTIRL